MVHIEGKSKGELSNTSIQKKEVLNYITSILKRSKNTSKKMVV